MIRISQWMESHCRTNSRVRRKKKGTKTKQQDYDSGQSLDWKKINVIEDRFTKLEDALVDLQIRQFSSKNQNALDKVLSS